MFGYGRLTAEEKKEFWGVTTPSLLASSGLILGTAGAVLIFYRTPFVVFPVIGALVVAAAVRMNLKAGLSVKWRKVNLCLHVFFLAVLAAEAVLALILKHRGVF